MSDARLCEKFILDGPKLYRWTKNRDLPRLDVTRVNAYYNNNNILRTLQHTWFVRYYDIIIIIIIPTTDGYSAEKVK